MFKKMATTSTTTTATKAVESAARGSNSESTCCCPTAATATITHGNICIICRQVCTATCCCTQTATATSSSSYAKSSSVREGRRRRSDSDCDATPTTFPSKLAAAQHCCCQQHVASVANECCCTTNSNNSKNSRNNSRRSSNSTNDNNQKVTATTTNCHCNNNINIISNNCNNKTNSDSYQQLQLQRHRQRLQQYDLNILGTLQLLSLFLWQHCCNVYKRLRRQQHHLWERSLAAITIIALITMQVSVVLAITVQHPQTIQQQQATSNFANTLEEFTRVKRSDNSNSNSNMNSNNINRNNNNSTDIQLAQKEITCRSMDIRNNISELNQLANCTVIEGFLLITLITDADKLNTTYPLLTEVTDYVLVYRVANLFSLSQIFPNLAVIRGINLFERYALVIYQNRDLQEVGLTNLRAISRGAVRIEKNAYLCFVKTVNWRQILPNNATDLDLVLKFNRKDEECPRCPGENIGEDGQENTMMDSSDVASCKEYKDNRRYCWNSKSCQTICPKECPHNCIDENHCCNDSCLGGCSKNTGDCVACRNVSIYGGHCIDQCPDGYFKYEKRCITAKMCEKIGTKYENSKELPLVHYNGLCTTKCEPGYAAKNNTCQKCNGTCENICEGGIIDNVLRAKEMRGCTEIGIKEGLTISIKLIQPQMMEAFEEGLSAVHTINTFLKVHLSYVTTLSFFKSLRHIRGKILYDGAYALYVLENRDLASLFNENQTVWINGSVFFHFNPKLCLETIDKLKPMLPNKPTKFSKNEVAEDSNGNKGTCNTKWLNVKVMQIASTIITVYINNTIVDFDDERSFIGYQLYHTPDRYGNVTRDTYASCSDNWNVSEPSKENLILVGPLLPYTNYAFYVRTMTISSEKRNYQSDLIRIKTLPAQPGDVRKLTARSTDSSEILVSWRRPLSANGKLIKYQVRAELTRWESQLEHQRNFCRDPLPTNINQEEILSPDEKTIKETSVPGDDCDCREDSPAVYNPQTVEEKVIDEIEFENALQNFLYVAKKKDELPFLNSLVNVNANGIDDEAPSLSPNALQRRRKRFIEMEEEDDYMDSVLMRHVRSASWKKLPKSNMYEPMDKWMEMTQKDQNNSYYKVFSTEVDANTTEFLFKNLRHFSLYSITVRACRESLGVNDTNKECSEALVPTDKRTMKKEHMDKAFNLTGSLLATTLNTTKGNVRLTWNPPMYPNGGIVSYIIIYKRQEQDAFEEKRCITVQDYKNQSGYVVTNLNEGKYSFRIRTNSLAGEGDLTDYVYVTVPPPGLSTMEITFIVTGVMFFLTLIIFLPWYFIYERRKRGHPQDLVINTEVNPFYASLQYVPDDWELPRERVIHLGPLGQGSFGMVYEGILKAQCSGDDDTPCAIKTVNDNATDRERINFLSEASVMKEFDTYHVVRLLGVCSQGQPALVVMELMKKGDLKSYLRAHRPDERADVLAVYQQRIGLTTGTGAALGAVQPPPYSRIFQMAIEIADGMAYLAAKKFVHRDLAARNCMVAADLTVKIGDFGMTRDIYETDYYRKGTKGLLPVRWMPPESLRDGVYASSSDVFSYGVVLWEMATLASQPYQGLSNEQVLRYVIEGGIMERPENCPDVLHKLMHRCWHHRPKARPSFLDIIAYLESLADPHFKEVAFYYSDAGVQYREKERKERTNQLDVFAGAQHDADLDATEDATTPLRVGEYQGYKSNMEHNTSLEQPAESPIALVDDQATTHSPFSMHSGFIVSSTPDALSTLPTAGGSQLEDAAYVQPDADNDRGYEPYDPSPNFADLPHSGGGRLSGEQHLLPKSKRGAGMIIPSMSSSMPDEVIGGSGATGAGVSSSLQPSTASAASSNASSSRHPSLKRVVADTLRNRVGNAFLSRFNHKRSGSNVSHKSNISNAPSNSSNTNLTSHPAGMAMVTMGPNLGTIESGGSGSAGSYAGTSRFHTPTATTPSGGGGNGSTSMISDNPNYKLLDESVNSSDPWPQQQQQQPQQPQLTTSSLNPNYELMQPPSVQETGGAATPFSLLSDNPNYVLMNEPQTETPQSQSQVYTSDNPNYAAMRAPTQKSSGEDENDDEDDDDNADEHTEDIKMERMPLSRQKQKVRIKPQQQQPRSRSVSQTRKAEKTAAATAAAAAAAAAATEGNRAYIIKENWLRQASTPRPPPPNGFIGRDA